MPEPAAAQGPRFPSLVEQMAAQYGWTTLADDPGTLVGRMLHAWEP